MMNDELTRVNMPDPQDQVAPFPGRELERWWWRNARTMRNQLRRQAMMADAAHFVAVPAVVTDHLRALVRYMLRDGGQEVGGGEDLEVAVDLGIEPGAVDDHVRGGFERHLFHGEGIPQDVFLKCHLTAQV